MSALPPIAALFGAFQEANPATVTVPGGSPVSAVIAWGPSRSTQTAIGNAGLLDTMPTAAFRVSEVGHLPRGTRVECPPMGGSVSRVWTVREVYEVDAEVVVVGLA